MRIDSAKTYLVEGIKYNWILLKLTTDSGVVGWGEATNWPGSPLVEAACEHVGRVIIGMDPRRIDFIWTKLYRDMNNLGQTGPLLSAIAGVDIALWDIKGKMLDVPVYELLGGAYRKKIELYANYWFIEGSHNADDYARQAKQVVELGFTGLKFDPFAHVNYVYGNDLATNGSLTESQKRLAVEVVDSVAKAVGKDIAIAIETHAFMNAPTTVEMAHRLARLGFNCMWYEEPALPEFPEEIADIRRRIPFPVCVGERVYSRFMLRMVLEKQAADVVMPDITRCGGITELRKMANLAECYNVPFAPHSPNGPLSTIASAHVMATIPNFFRQEFMLKDVPWRDECISQPLPIKDGNFVLPERPGLGFDVNEEVLGKHPGVTDAAGRNFYV
jgi:galactonate dehydratase